MEYYKTRTEIYGWLRIYFGLVFLGFKDEKLENLKFTWFTDYILDT